MKSIIIALFAGMIGCAFVQPVSAAKPAKPREQVVWSFGSGADGQGPAASLINVKGTLYGTTPAGGMNGGGTVFALDIGTGAETTLYPFCSQQNCTDGEAPDAGLIDIKGTLYGTTLEGGTNDCAHGCGTVFSLDPGTGTETTLHAFCAPHDCSDGYSPFASLLDLGGLLYGTTSGGGGMSCSDSGCGTVFSIDPNTGVQTVIYTFCTGHQNCPDGRHPQAGLIALNGILYGATPNGGGGCKFAGCGTVFSLDPATGTETVLHSFDGASDGQVPMGSLIAVNGVLYGTTEAGGNTGRGTVFSLDPATGTETVLHTFGSGKDGAVPLANVIDVKGTLYGTTRFGGTNGRGTVFSLDPATGAETVVYSFCSLQQCADGQSPESGLIAVKGKLYGTTIFGGAYGFGTVFAVRK